MVERVQRARVVRVQVDLVEVLVRNNVHIRIAAEQQRAHVILGANAGARKQHGVNDILGGRFSGHQICDVSVILVIKLVGAVGDRLWMIPKSSLLHR